MPSDTNGAKDIFVRDRLTGTTERVSVDSNGLEGNGDSHEAVISANGMVVSFGSRSTNFVNGGTNGKFHTYVHDRASGETEIVSVSTAGAHADDSGTKSWPSADGRYVAFDSRASNLVPGDVNGMIDIFVRDRVAGTTEVVSVDSNGNQVQSPPCEPPSCIPISGSHWPVISQDGNVIVFESRLADFVAGDTNGVGDVFVHYRSSGITERVSVSPSGAENPGHTSHGRLSGDGRYVVFASSAGGIL